jgi:hypothetical protein
VDNVSGISVHCARLRAFLTLQTHSSPKTSFRSSNVPLFESPALSLTISFDFQHHLLSPSFSNRSKSTTRKSPPINAIKMPSFFKLLSSNQKPSTRKSTSSKVARKPYTYSRDYCYACVYDVKNYSNRLSSEYTKQSDTVMKRLEKMESHLNSRLDEIDARLDRTEDRLDNLKTISD